MLKNSIDLNSQAFARRLRRVIGRAVALDAAEVAARQLCVAHAEVDAVAGHAHLQLESDAALPTPCVDG